MAFPFPLDRSVCHRFSRAAAGGACARRTRRRCWERSCLRYRIRTRRRPVSDSVWPPAPLFLRRALRSRLAAGQLRLLPPPPFSLTPPSSPAPRGGRGPRPPGGVECRVPGPAPARGAAGGAGPGLSLTAVGARGSGAGVLRIAAPPQPPWRHLLAPPRAGPPRYRPVTAGTGRLPPPLVSRGQRLGQDGGWAPGPADPFVERRRW